MKFPFYLFSSITLAALLSSGGTVQAQSLSRTSPFIAPNSPGNSQGPSGAPTMYAMVGVVGGERTTRIGILDLSTRKSVWIPIGQMVGGVEALSYNPSTDEAVVRINGTLQTLSLRMPGLNATMYSASAMPTPLNGSPAHPGGGFSNAPFGLYPAGPGPFPPGTPGGGLQSSPPPQPLAATQAPPKPGSTQADQERDARMLVSDLMDIGMQQRKAYQDAQKKAQQAQKPAQPTQSPSSPTPPHRP